MLGEEECYQEVGKKIKEKMDSLDELYQRAKHTLPSDFFNGIPAEKFFNDRIDRAFDDIKGYIQQYISKEALDGQKAADNGWNFVIAPLSEICHQATNLKKGLNLAAFMEKKDEMFEALKKDVSNEFGLVVNYKDPRYGSIRELVDNFMEYYVAKDEWEETARNEDPLASCEIAGQASGPCLFHDRQDAAAPGGNNEVHMQGVPA